MSEIIEMIQVRTTENWLRISDTTIAIQCLYFTTRLCCTMHIWIMGNQLKIQKLNLLDQRELNFISNLWHTHVCSTRSWYDMPVSISVAFILFLFVDVDRICRYLQKLHLFCTVFRMNSLSVLLSLYMSCNHRQSPIYKPWASGVPFLPYWKGIMLRKIHLNHWKSLFVFFLIREMFITMKMTKAHQSTYPKQKISYNGWTQMLWIFHTVNDRHFVTGRI